VRASYNRLRPLEKLQVEKRGGFQGLYLQTLS
jgi:hypothetical protein